MSQSVTLRARGLYTFPNTLSELPDGALTEANNIVIDRDSVISPRRGFKIYGDELSDTRFRADQLIMYKNRVLRHYNGILDADADGSGTFAILTSDVMQVSPSTRIKSIEMNGNLYFTTSTGVKKISVSNVADLSTAPVTDSGGIEALDVDAVLNSTPGFLTQDSVVAYRIVWGIKDPNNNLILGAPSSRVVVYNDLLSLIITDYNGLCTGLAAAVAANGGAPGPNPLVYANYASFKVGPNTDAPTLQDDFKTLCLQLDTDLATHAYFGRTGSIISSTTGGSSTTVESTAHGLVTGEQVIIAGSDSTPSIDGTWVVTVTDANHFSINTVVTVAATTGTFTQPSIYNNNATTFDSPPTDNELLSLQNLYNDIVNALTATSVSQISLAAQTAGDFQNATESSTVNLTITIPPGVTTNHLYQVYRTQVFQATGTTILSDLDPGDEMGLVFESNPTSGDLVNGFVFLTDITPESFRGANLYTNEFSGEGIINANYPPPCAVDIALFKQVAFYANTFTKHTVSLSLLGVSGLIGGSFITTDGITTHTYTFVDSVQQETAITLPAGSTFPGSGASDYFDLFSANNATTYRFWFQKGTSVAPSGSGVTLVEVAILNADANTVVATKLNNAINAQPDFFATVSTNVVAVINKDVGFTNSPSNHVTAVGFSITVAESGSGENAASLEVGVSNAATPAQQVDLTARSLVRVVNKQSGEIVSATYVSGPKDVPGMMVFKEREITTDGFSISSSGGIDSNFNPSLVSGGVPSTNDVAPNRLYYSKTQQPEAVPILQYTDIGPKDKAILRVVPLRDSLFVLTEAGVYRLSGETPQTFVVSLFDSSSILISPDTAAVLNNQIYMFSNQGIVTISDTGVSVLSRPIENSLLPLINYPAFTNFSFATGYESDRSYLVWTVQNSFDETATQCFRYNTFTQTWVRWDSAKTSVAHNALIDKLYLGAADVPFIEIERKDFLRTDYCDRQNDLTIPQNGYTGFEFLLGGLFGMGIGDTIVQTQYLTVSQYNRLLLKLDNDTGLLVHDFYSTLVAGPGDDMGTNLQELVDKLNDPATGTDGGYTCTNPSTTTFPQMQIDFNAIVTKLNNDTHTRIKTYRTSEDTVEWEVAIKAIGKQKSALIVDFSGIPYIKGPAIGYKAITSKITWAPHHFGDPSQTKHIRDATILFENQGFNDAVARFSSDLSTGEQTVPYNGEGVGTWGGFAWGQSTWGGDGSMVPLRTYVPREKARCRFIMAGVTHTAAMEEFSIFGLSFTFEVVSTRGYR